MSEPWNLTEAQRRQFREAHGEAKRAKAPDFPDTIPASDSDDLTATLDQIKADHEAANTFGANASDPVPRLLSALGKVLELADEAEPWGWKPGERGVRIPVRWDLDPAMIREAIARELTERSPEPGDDEGDDMEGEHIVHYVRDPKGDEAAHG